MTLIVDTREHWTHDGSKDAHIRDWLERHQIPYRIEKLDEGDYTLDRKTVIDRKQNLDEVAWNLLNRRDSTRFWNEIRRAHQKGIHLIVLVEHGPNIKSVSDVAKWRSGWSGASGRAVADAMIRTEMAYGVAWRFCSKRNTAKMIYDILTENLRHEAEDKPHNLNIERSF